MAHNITIHFGSRLANLYGLGWISTDLSQMVEFAQLLEVGDVERAEKFFGERARPFNRFAIISDIKDKRPEIVEVRKGSIELTLAQAGLAAAIIMPLVQVGVGALLRKVDTTVTFEVTPDDQILKQLLDDFQKGNLGRGTEGLNTLFYLLEQRNYNVRVLADNVFLIDRAVDRYARRIARTIRRST